MLRLQAHVHMQLFSHTSTFYMYVCSLLTSQQPHPLQWQSSTAQRIDTRTSFLVSGFSCLGMRNYVCMYVWAWLHGVLSHLHKSLDNMLSLILTDLCMAVSVCACISPSG